MTVCEFDRLLSRRVLHIHEKIFFSLDYASFKSCLKVCRSWNDVLTSEPFRRKGKSVFCEEICRELQLAAMNGQADEVQIILSSGMVDINCGRQTPLFLAASSGHKAVVQLLLEGGAELNKQHTKLENAPLHKASYGGFLDVVKVLLDGGAEPNIVNLNGNTPLHFAAWIGHNEIVQLLFERGAVPNMANEYGETPLYDAASRGYKDVIKLLLYQGAEPNIVSGWGITPLQHAAKAGYKDVVQVLLDSGADPNMADQTGLQDKTALSWALLMGHEDIANILREKGGTE